MSKYNYLVYGAGRQGTAAVYDLALNCEAKHISIVDPDQEARLTAYNRLLKLLGDSWVGKDCPIVFHEKIDPHHLGGFHAALCCSPYSTIMELMKKTAEKKVPFCDLGGNPDVVAQQRQYAEANSIETGIAPDCGVSPGLTNIIAAHLISLYQVDQLAVRCGGIPYRPPRNAFLYKLTFDPAGLISEYSGQVPIICDGELKMIPALSICDSFGEYECFPTSNNSPAVVEWLLKQGIKDYEYRTIRYPGHLEKVLKDWKGEGYLSGDEEKDAELIESLKEDRKLKYNPESDRDRIILSVVGYKSGRLRKQWGYSFDFPSDLKTRFSAMEMTTSWGITLVAYHMAKENCNFHGPGFFGVRTPEQFMDGGWVIDQLSDRMEGATL